MQLSDHSLRQIDEAYLERLGEDSLRSLSSKLLLDLKEARERLNQTSRNSSLPPSREAPWDKARAPMARRRAGKVPGCAGAWAARTGSGGRDGSAPAGGMRGVRGRFGGASRAVLHGVLRSGLGAGKVRLDGEGHQAPV